MDSSGFSILRLQDDLSPPHDGLIRLPTLRTLQFVVKPGKCDLGSLELWTNYPDPSTQFARNMFHLVPGRDDLTVCGDWKAEIVLTIPGAFEYYTVCEGKQGPTGRFMVEPQLTVGGRPFPSEGVVLQTVLTRCLGPAEEWLVQIALSSRCGYNFVHFTPVQELGSSGSAYSIQNQTVLNNMLFPRIQPQNFQTLDDFEAAKMEVLCSVTERLRNTHEVLSMVDIVLNHTAASSQWLVEHPESAYNLLNSPQLKAAFCLDQLIQQLSIHLAESAFSDDKGCLGPLISTVEVADRILAVLKARIEEARLWEFFSIDVGRCLELYRAAFSCAAVPFSGRGDLEDVERALFPSGSGERFGREFSTTAAIRLFSEDRDALKKTLESIQSRSLARYETEIASAMEAIAGTIKYQWLEKRKGKKAVTRRRALLDPYFSVLPEGHREIALANNGFIWNGNPLEDFTEPLDGVPGSPYTQYFRRSIVVWGDCVKLRYGAIPEDSPWLWNHMSQYVAGMARAFDGFRLDNAHGTPLHVAAAMLDAARLERPHIYVCAELFTGSEALDVKFCSVLGINALVREAIQAANPRELARRVYRNGGQPVGSLRSLSATLSGCLHRPLPALLFDCTHDNDPPAVRRSAADALSTGALVCMAECAIGSIRGFDELYPRNVSVVSERRRYNTFGGDPMRLAGLGIVPVKAVLNRLHVELARRGFSEVHVHFDDVSESAGGDIITVTRCHPLTKESLVLTARTAFAKGEEHHTVSLPDVIIEGRISSVAVAARVQVSDVFEPHPHHITGLPSTLLFSTTDYSSLATIEEFQKHGVWHSRVCLRPHHFKPGSVLAFWVCPLESPGHSKIINESSISALRSALAGVDLLGLNYLLFRCDEEEKDWTNGRRGAYEVPDLGKLPWCGLAGVAAALRKPTAENDMGSALLTNIRDGDWLMDYTASRLADCPQLEAVQGWMRDRFAVVSRLPRGLVPQSFAAVVYVAVHAASDRALSLMSDFCRFGGPFVSALAMTSVQLYGICPSSPLVFDDSKATSREHEHCDPSLASLAAGVPHFCTGFMRNWGRDTFIALRGLLLTTGRCNEARHIILGFARAVRHGLIPNLLDGGNHPRYNARDATWFWLQAVQDYCKMVPNGKEVLDEVVNRYFHPTLLRRVTFEEECPIQLGDLIQDILQQHVQGIDFVELNAGKSLDEHMTEDGFHVQIVTDPETGFITGGNAHNCGTWMDKMGSCDGAKNRGIPATPRDGAPIEITGLLYSTLAWLDDLHSNVRLDGAVRSPQKVMKLSHRPPSLAVWFPHEGVRLSGGGFMSWKEWAGKIASSFRLAYLMPRDSPDTPVYFRDTVGGAVKWADNQLRPNQVVAMAVAPVLFEPEDARAALDTVERRLFAEPNQIGLKTLDPADWGYRPDYDNSALPEPDPAVAAGWNYHQGPEWVWPLGYFIRARILFPPAWIEKSPAKLQTLRRLILRKLAAVRRHLLVLSPYGALPELTNRNGAYCKDSCPAQAWSGSTVLDAVFDLSVLLSESELDPRCFRDQHVELLSTPVSGGSRGTEPQSPSTSVVLTMNS